MDVGGDFTNAGGAFGFDTEASAGASIPTRDSLDRFLSPRDQRRLWDPSSLHGAGSGPEIFHTSPYSDYTAVGRLGQFNTALWHRYGPWAGLAGYEREAQAAGYEVARAQFEATIGQAHDRANPSTGLIYWQLNKAWPSLQWQLYGHDLDQAGVYFGARKANERLHILYAYSDGSVRVSNLIERAAVRPAGPRRVPLARRSPARGAHGLRPAPRGPGHRDGAAPRGAGEHDGRPTSSARAHARRPDDVSRNVYWLSRRRDVVDWHATLGQGTGAAVAPGGYADLSGLQRLGQVPVDVRATTTRRWRRRSSPPSHVRDAAGGRCRRSSCTRTSAAARSAAMTGSCRSAGATTT